MGQQANSGRNASLDDKKLRAAGRGEQNPQLNQAKDPNWDIPAKGKTGGAFGKVTPASLDLDNAQPRKT